MLGCGDVAVCPIGEADDAGTEPCGECGVFAPCECEDTVAIPVETMAALVESRAA